MAVPSTTNARAPSLVSSPRQKMTSDGMSNDDRYRVTGCASSKYAAPAGLALAHVGVGHAPAREPVGDPRSPPVAEGRAPVAREVDDARDVAERRDAVDDEELVDVDDARERLAAGAKASNDAVRMRKVQAR